MPGASYWSRAEDDDPPYWIGCMTRDPDGEGPHVYFIRRSTDWVLFFCEACMPNRSRPPKETPVATAAPDRSDPPPEAVREAPPPVATAPEPMGKATYAPHPDGPPWGHLPPPWELLRKTHPRRAAAMLEWWEERAAIMEYDGKMARAAAERAAYALLTRRLGEDAH